MIEFKLMKTRICLDFSFFAVLTVFFFFNSGNALCAFMCCIFHELGHLIAMRLCGVNADRLLFYGGGIRLSAELDDRPFRVRMTVLSAGCVFNFLLALIFLCCGIIEAAVISLFTGILNLMPFSYLDGAQIFRAMFERHSSGMRVAARSYRIFQLVVLGIAAAFAAIYGVIPDITLLFFIAYCLLVSKI